MYICVCNAIRECELREAARACPGGANKVYGALSCEAQCGQCLDEAEELIAEERRAVRIEAMAKV